MSRRKILFWLIVKGQIAGECHFIGEQLVRMQRVARQHRAMWVIAEGKREG